MPEPLVHSVRNEAAKLPEPLVYTVDEVAKLLRISRPKAFEGVHCGEIPHIRVGRRILVPRAALEALLGEGSPQPPLQQ